MKRVFFIFGLGKIGSEIFNKLKLFKKTRGYEVYGFDIDIEKINEKDTFHISDFKSLFRKKFSKENDSETQFIYIANLPTNIDEETKKPDTYPFGVLQRTIKKVARTEDIFINQSTVYPGFTLEFGFQCGFQHIFMIPERFDETNPVLNFERILGFVNSKHLEFIKDIYAIIGYKIVRTTNLENAEASKMLENIQRDVNIALMNEFKNTIKKLNNDISLKLDMDEILDCAGTKKNFAKYKPGMVGGHCIPYDPYWFLYKAKELGADPKLIKCAREINEDEIKNTYIEILEDIVKDDYNAIAIHGITYKNGSKDYKHSPAFKILLKLQECNIPWDKDIFIWDEDLTRDEVEELRNDELNQYMNYYDLKDKSRISKTYYLKENLKEK